MSIQHYQSDRPAFSGARPIIENGYVVGTERFSVPPLPESIIDQVFAKFGLRYTKRWAEETACVDVSDLKMEWRRCLAGVDIKAVKWALDELPDSRPPTVGEFSAICKRWPGRKVEDNKPPGNHPIARKVADKIKALLLKNAEEKLVADEAEKRKRLGLGENGPAPNPSKPIPASLLPPGMVRALSDGDINYWDKGSK